MHKFHTLKILPTYFKSIFLGYKNFEIRKKDRDFKVGDGLILQEFENEKYTGRIMVRYISYIYDGNGEYGLSDGYCILGIKSSPIVNPIENGLWNNHEVACLLADLFGGACACDYAGIDEWLPEKCDFLETCCPHPVGVACWEQFLKHSNYKEEGLK